MIGAVGVLIPELLVSNVHNPAYDLSPREKDPLERGQPPDGAGGRHRRVVPAAEELAGPNFVTL